MRPNKQIQMKAQVLLRAVQKIWSQYQWDCNEASVSLAWVWAAIQSLGAKQGWHTRGDGTNQSLQPRTEPQRGGRSLVFPPADPNGYRHSPARIHAGTRTENPRQRRHDRKQIFQFNGELKASMLLHFLICIRQLPANPSYLTWGGKQSFSVRDCRGQKKEKKRNSSAVFKVNFPKEITTRKSRE